MWHYIHQRLLISLTVICLLLVGLGNALHTYANPEGQVPDMLATLPGQLKFVHVVRAQWLLLLFRAYHFIKV